MLQKIEASDLIGTAGEEREMSEVERQLPPSMLNIVAQMDQVIGTVVALRKACVPLLYAGRWGTLTRSKAELQSQRARLFAADNRCHFCRRELRLFSDTTLDHLLPKCRGGDDSDGNLALCCTECNGAKGALTEDEYRAALNVEPDEAEKTLACETPSRPR